MTNKRFLDKMVNLLYDKTRLSVLVFFFLGLILRLFAARNMGVSADDVNHAIFPIGIFNSGKLVFWGGSTNLWYYIQGTFYKIFGLSMIASRFAAALLGSLLIILMFVFVKKVFKSEKAALIASFLVAISPMLIKSALPEMDIAAAFFMLFSAYFLFSFFESKSNKHLILSALLIGVGVMIKLYVLFFAFSFLVLILIKGFKTEKNTKKIIKQILLFGVIVFILIIPSLTHNYLLYKDKGFMDLIFTNTFKFGAEKAEQHYGWGAGWMPYTDYKGFFFGNQRNFEPTPLPGALVVLGFLLKGAPLLFILGVLGLVLVFKRNREYFWFFIITFVPAFIYLGAQIPMDKHFIWGLILLAPCAGVFGKELINKLKKVRLRYFLLILLIFNLFYLGMPNGYGGNAHFYGKSSYGKLTDYKNQIPENTLVVVDSRIYRGNIHWAFAGTSYIEAAHFFNIANELNSKGNTQNLDVYYIECVKDDCGWGTIAGQPEFNASMEQITEWFSNRSYATIDFKGPNRHTSCTPFSCKKEIEYRIHKSTLALNPAILDAVKLTHKWFLYPIGYDRSISEIFDDYEVHGPIDGLINKLSWMILYLELIFVFFAMIYILYLFVIEE
jgi:hypothetical protein